MKKIAVVVLNWNGAKLLEQFLPSVIQYSPEATIYVADNASNDESVAFVKNNYPAIKIIQNKTNQGFAGGYNDALQHVDAEIYALVNSDIEVTENWLKPILKTFETETKTAIIQPKILDFKKKGYFEYAGAGGGFIDKFGYPFCRGRIFDTLEKDNGQYNDQTEIFWASGACFFIRSAVYKELKGFDEDFFAHQEEIDLCWRTINKGYKIKYCSESTVYHVGGATLQQANPQKTFLNFRNSLLMLTKNLPQNTLLQILIIRLFLDGIAGVKFILGGQFIHCWAIIRAHFSFYRLFLRNYRKREKNQIRLYFKTKSIVYGYYVKNGTVFAELI